MIFQQKYIGGIGDGHARIVTISNWTYLIFYIIGTNCSNNTGCELDFCPISLCRKYLPKEYKIIDNPLVFEKYNGQLHWLYNYENNAEFINFTIEADNICTVAIHIEEINNLSNYKRLKFAVDA